MPLVTTTEMFKKAYNGGYAIGAFNVNNMEIVQGITEAAKEVSAPLILQVSKGARAYANHTYLPEDMQADYDKYWTDERVDRVLDVLQRHSIALEINPRYRIPSIDIIRKAIEAPMRAIAQNAGFEGSVVVEKVKSLPAGECLNCANGEYGNMIEMGVNDPVKVTRTALQSAASVAGLILITEATINEMPKDGPDLSALAGAMGGGGGMY